MAGKETRNTRTLVVAAAFIVIVAAVAGVAIYRDQVAPFRTTVLVVGDRSITMRYFLKRVLLSGREPLDMLQVLTGEEIIRQVAPGPPYNIRVSDEDVDRFLRDLARGRSQSLSESDFREWYRQTLNESKLSDAEMRDLARTGVLTARLSEYLAQRTPTVAEQVRLYMIPVKEAAEARKAKERLKAGEAFQALARELSTDPKLRENGGELGWFPRAALAPQIGRAAFDELAVGEASEPLELGGQVVVIMVGERAASRQIEAEALEKVKASALEDWIAREYRFQKVEFHGFHNGYDSETDAWVKWQLQRMRKTKPGGRK